jgi:hypothetical protein
MVKKGIVKNDWQCTFTLAKDFSSLLRHIALHLKQRRSVMCPSFKIRLLNKNALIYLINMIISLLFLFSSSNAISIHDGFPLEKALINSRVYTPIMNFDYDRDGETEIVIFSGSTRYEEPADIYIIDGEGNIERSYPFHAQSIEGIEAGVTFSDIDNDGAFEMVFVARNISGILCLYAINPDGSDQTGFPVAVNTLFGDLGPINRPTAELTIYDLDGDGYQEIILTDGHT